MLTDPKGYGCEKKYCPPENKTKMLGPTHLDFCVEEDVNAKLHGLLKSL